jgi:CheY-like chemotaxis protein
MEKVFSMLLDDLASGELVLQKAALIKISRFDDADFQSIVKLIFNGPRRLDAKVLNLVLEIRKNRSLEQKEPQKEVFDLEKVVSKSEDEILADWKSAGVRIKLAMLKHASQFPSAISSRLCAIALKDASPLVRLEAENISETKKEPEEMDEAAIDELIEEYARDNPFLVKDKPLKEMRALIVDDSKTIQRIIKEYLTPHLHVMQAFSAAEALMLVEMNSFNIIFLDISMPDKDGLDLLGELRDRGVESAIVIMSALDSRHIIQTSFALGANYFISKNKMANMLKTNKMLAVLNRLSACPVPCQ